MIISHKGTAQLGCNGNETTLRKIQQIANTFIRIIHQIQYKLSVKDTMCIHGLIAMEQIQLDIACFTFKYWKNLLPNSFAYFFSNNFIDTSNKKKNMKQLSLFPIIL